MRTYETFEEAAADKLLRLAIPVDQAGCRYHVVVAIEPEASGAAPIPAQAWPAGFFERTAGAWQGELARESQGTYESREDL